MDSDTNKLFKGSLINIFLCSICYPNVGQVGSFKNSRCSFKTITSGDLTKINLEIVDKK